MRRKLTYTALVKTATLVCFLLAMPLCASASDTTHIAFTSERDGNAEIYIMDINGKNLRNLTNHPASDFSPAFSPDGRWIAYVSNRDIHLINLATKEKHLLTDGKEPDWSPDSKFIVFVSKRAGRSDIYKMNINGEEVQQLTNDADNYNPSWSPDGQWIAFSSKQDGIPLSVYVMTADGRRRRKLAQGLNPSWSPDGKQIAYTLGIAGNGIYVMSARGQNSRRVTPENVWSDQPAWSPDGQWIAYEVELDPWGDEPDANIYLISPDGGNPRRLTNHPAMDTFPAWGPAGFSLSVFPTERTQTTLWGKLKQF